jgi:hypothetical protein
VSEQLVPRDRAGADRFEAFVRQLLDELPAHGLVSKSRCVDHLLDLYNLNPTLVTKQLIELALADTRHINAVRVEAMRHTLDAFAASCQRA